MIALIVCGMVAMLAWLLVSERLRRWHISAPVAMVLLGIGTGFFFVEEIATELNTDVAERVAELILAMLLFIDAIEVRGGYLGRERGIAARLLAIAFPVSLVLAVLVGIPLLGASSLIAVLVIALVVIPLDFAPAAGFLRDSGIPQRVRHGLAVESGYVDAIRAPIFAFALVAIRYPDESHGWLDLVQHALPDIGFAIVFGVGIGGLAGLLTRGALRRGWASGHGIRLGMVLIPLITYACSVAVHGNGFVAAFIAGISYRLTRFKGEGPRDEARLKEEVSLLDGIGENASLLMWFVFGSTVSIIFLTPVEWAWILFGVLALTVLRFVPVVLAFIGSEVPFRERAVMGLMGPRGTSTIVFGLLAFNAMQSDDDTVVLYVMVVTVLASVILHGFLGTRLSKRILGRGVAAGRTPSPPAREERPHA